MKQLKIVIDLCIYDENDQVHKASEYEQECLDGFHESMEGLFFCSLDTLWFERKDVDQRVFIMQDGGDMILLKNGKLINVCWRGDQCRVWPEDGRSSTSKHVKKLLRKAGLL